MTYGSRAKRRVEPRSGLERHASVVRESGSHPPVTALDRFRGLGLPGGDPRHASDGLASVRHHRREHAGTINQVLEITEIVAALHLLGADLNPLELRFVPATAAAAGADFEIRRLTIFTLGG